VSGLEEERVLWSSAVSAPPPPPQHSKRRRLSESQDESARLPRARPKQTTNPNNTIIPNPQKPKPTPKKQNRTDFEGYDDDETVRVVLTGNQAPKAVEVTAEAMALGEEELSARLTAAMKDAHTKSVAGMREKMKGLAASLGLPAGGGMPGM
jgi:DNA-binding protein YbaB